MANRRQRMIRRLIGNSDDDDDNEPHFNFGNSIEVYHIRKMRRRITRLYGHGCTDVIEKIAGNLQDGYITSSSDITHPGALQQLLEFQQSRMLNIQDQNISSSDGSAFPIHQEPLSHQYPIQNNHVGSTSGMSYIRDMYSFTPREQYQQQLPE